jgi:methylated-DNA-protein-cysteine methyltransferase related protein
MKKQKSAPHYHERVFEVARQIPLGRVTTYGAIADYLSLGSARMVGWALFNNLSLDDVPAHRVLNRNGELSGRVHFKPPELMQALLEAEGIVIKNDQVVDFASKFWHPQELGF